jgi:predicted DNA binding CopG/RHH family protein
MKNSKKTSNKKNNVLADPLDKDLSSLFSSSGWKKIKFELKPKNKSITIRISEEMLEAIKEKANDEGLDYQKWIRSSIEDALNKIA